IRPIWFSKSRRSRSISAGVFFFRPNIKYAATTAASPASRRVYKRNGIFDKAPGVLSTKHKTRNAFREETRELRKSRKAVVGCWTLAVLKTRCRLLCLKRRPSRATSPHFYVARRLFVLLAAPAPCVT